MFILDRCLLLKRTVLLEFNFEKQFRMITFVYLGINHEVERMRTANKDYHSRALTKTWSTRQLQPRRLPPISHDFGENSLSAAVFTINNYLTDQAKHADR